MHLIWTQNNAGKIIEQSKKREQMFINFSSEQAGRQVENNNQVCEYTHNG